MTLEEACRLLDPNTTAEELAKIEYYNGFNGSTSISAAPGTASPPAAHLYKQA